MKLNVDAYGIAADTGFGISLYDGTYVSAQQAETIRKDLVGRDRIVADSFVVRLQAERVYFKAESILSNGQIKITNQTWPDRFFVYQEHPDGWTFRMYLIR